MNKKIKKYIIGIDIGGTTCKIALFTMDMTMIKKWQIDTDKTHNGKNVIKKCVVSILLNIYKNNIYKNEIYGIGVALPGPIENESIIKKAINIGWKKNYNIKNELQKYFDKTLKIVVANDANAAAYGEYNVLDKKINSLVMVTLGTGIGGGLIYDNKICNGRNGSAMEIGHIVVDNSDTKKKCNCGSVGCVETIAGSNHIKEDFIKNLNDKKLSHIKSIYRTYKKIDIKNITVKNIFDMAKKKDALCVYTIKNAMRYVGYMLSNIILTVDPDMIVIGGGISNAGSMILRYIKDGIIEKMKMIENIPIIKISKLKNDAGVIGAGYLIKNKK